MLDGLAGLALPAALDLSMWSVVFLTLLGVSLAANLPLPPPLLAGLAGLYGALQGLMNGSTLTAIGAGWPWLLGIVTAVLLLGLLLAALALSLRAEWTRIAVRVVGSWVSADRADPCRGRHYRGLLSGLNHPVSEHRVPGTASSEVR